MEETVIKEYRLEHKEVVEAVYDYFVKKGIEGIFQPSHVKLVCLTNEFAEEDEIEAKLELKMRNIK